MRTVKHLVFQTVFVRIALLKTVQNQCEHKFGRVVAIVGIRHFQDPKFYGPIYARNLHNTQILPIARFSQKLVKKLKQTSPISSPNYTKGVISNVIATSTPPAPDPRLSEATDT